MKENEKDKKEKMFIILSSPFTSRVLVLVRLVNLDRDTRSFLERTEKSIVRNFVLERIGENNITAKKIDARINNPRSCG